MLFPRRLLSVGRPQSERGIRKPVDREGPLKYTRQFYESQRIRSIDFKRADNLLVFLVTIGPCDLEVRNQEKSSGGRLVVVAEFRTGPLSAVNVLDQK